MASSILPSVSFISSSYPDINSVLIKLRVLLDHPNTGFMPGPILLRPDPVCRVSGIRLVSGKGTQDAVDGVETDAINLKTTLVVINVVGVVGVQKYVLYKLMYVSQKQRIH